MDCTIELGRVFHAEVGEEEDGDEEYEDDYHILCHLYHFSCTKSVFLHIGPGCRGFWQYV